MLAGAECSQEHAIALPNYWRRDLSERVLYECLPKVCVGEKSALQLVLGEQTLAGSASLADTVKQLEIVALSGICRQGNRSLNLTP